MTTHTRGTLLDTLCRTRPALIDYPPEVQVACAKAFDAWIWFCGLSQTEKDTFTYTDDPNDNIDGAGYERKRKAGQLDPKETFHVTLREQARLQGIARGLELNAALTFIRNAYAALEALAPLVEQQARELQDGMGVKDLVDEVMIHSRPRWILRYLHYFPGHAPGEILGAPHPDKSGFTIYLYEDRTGVEWLTQSRDWERLEKPPTGKTWLTANIQLQYKYNDAKALYHQVISEGMTEYWGRKSMVLFVPFVQTLTYQPGRTQLAPIGFNYDGMDAELFQRIYRMNADEFAAYLAST